MYNSTRLPSTTAKSGIRASVWNAQVDRACRRFNQGMPLSSGVNCTRIAGNAGSYDAGSIVHLQGLSLSVGKVAKSAIVGALDALPKTPKRKAVCCPSADQERRITQRSRLAQLAAIA